MENNSWNPAVWKRWESESYVKTSGRVTRYNYESLPSVDWTNVGPVLGSNIRNEILGETPASSTLQTQKYKFIKMKDVYRHFPLKKSLQFAYPLTNPRTGYKSCRCMENCNFLWHQGGNNLTLFKSKRKQFAVYPENIPNKEPSIIVSEMIPRNFGDTEDYIDKVFYCFKEHSSVLFDFNDEICQVIAKEVNNRNYVVTRSTKAVQYCSLKENLSLNTKVSISHFEDPHFVSSATMSDMIPGYFATAVSSGIISLYDCTRLKNEPVWEHCFTNENSECVYQCEFGRHVLSLIVNNKSSVWDCDTRNRSNCNEARLLFNLKDLYNYINPLDTICKVVRSELHRLYAVTSSCVLLMDERYCKLPVMRWEHMFSIAPSFAAQCSIKDLELLIFGNPSDFRLCSLYQDLSKNSISKCVSGLPYYYNFVQDTLQFAHQKNIWFNIHADRIGNRVTGIASCVNPTDDSSLCVLTLNDTGDIFIQDFHVQNNAIAVNQEKLNACEQTGKELLQAWEKKIISMNVKEKNKTKSKLINENSAQKSVTESKLVNVVEFYSNMKSILNSNDLCLKGNHDQWRVENYVLNKFSDKKVNFSHIVKGNSGSKDSLASFLPEEFSFYIKPSYFKNCKDELSCSLLKVWEEQIEAEESDHPSVEYSRFPVPISNLSTHPKKMKLDHTINDTTFLDESLSLSSPLISKKLKTEHFINNSTFLDESSFLSSSKGTNWEFFSPTAHSDKKSVKRSLKKRVDGF